MTARQHIINITHKLDATRNTAQLNAQRKTEQEEARQDHDNTTQHPPSTKLVTRQDTTTQYPGIVSLQLLHKTKHHKNYTIIYNILEQKKTYIIIINL